MAKCDFIKSLDELNAFISSEADENGNISTDAFARLCGVYPKYFQFDLLDIRSDLTEFLLVRDIVAYHVFDNGIKVSELFVFISYYARDGRTGFAHVTNRNGYARAKAILKLPKLKEHLAKFRP